MSGVPPADQPTPSATPPTSPPVQAAQPTPPSMQPQSDPQPVQPQPAPVLPPATNTGSQADPTIDLIGMTGDDVKEQQRQAADVALIQIAGTLENIYAANPDERIKKLRDLATEQVKKTSAFSTLLGQLAAVQSQPQQPSPDQDRAAARQEFKSEFRSWQKENMEQRRLLNQQVMALAQQMMKQLEKSSQ